MSESLGVITLHDSRHAYYHGMLCAQNYKREIGTWVRDEFLGLQTLLWCCLATVSCSSSDNPGPKDGLSSDSERPNILLVVVDDMGFSDLGAFGGEINTPNLDALARDGIRFSNFQASPTCSPTRAMLLTGTGNHTAGLGNMAEELSPNQKGQPGYEGHISDRVVTLASLLRDSGYHTYMTGKWHLGFADETSPAARGFERSFAMLTGGASHFSDMKPAYSPDPNAKAPYRKDMEMLKSLPSNFQYSSQFYVDELIDYLKQDNQSGQPFFAYLAFTAPHWPLQAPEEAIAKYVGRYDAGYDVLAKQRLARQRSLGLIPETAGMAARAPKGKPWNELSAAEQKVEIRQMEIYAAMVDEIDVHIGRLLEYLNSQGQLDNTLVLFMSDNGAEGHDVDDTWPADMFPEIRKVVDESHDFSYDNMGKLNSYVFQGPNWAWAGQPALRGGKGAISEGGTRVAAFVHYPKGLVSGEIYDELVSVQDITPTLLELTGVAAPQGDYAGRAVAPMTGISKLESWQGSTPGMGKTRVLGMELMGKRSIRKDNWKLIHMPEPYGSGNWELYDLDNDFAERQDLAKEEPEKLQELLAHWQEYAKENGVILPDWVSGY